MADASKSRRGSGKRGYVLTLVVIMLFSVLALYATNTVNNRQQQRAILQNQFYAEKASYVLDDVAQDVRNVLRTDMSGNSIQIFISENLTYNKTSFLSSYALFLGNFSPITNANISLNYSDPLSISFSDGLTYQSNFTASQIDFYNSSGPSAYVTAYYVTITSNQTRGTVSGPAFVGSGVFVSVNYTDPAPSNSFVTTGYVNGSAGNVMTIEFPTASNYTNLSFGLVGGRQNAFSLQEVNVNAVTSLDLVVNRTSNGALRALYNLPFNMSLPYSNFTGYVPAQ